MCSIKRQSYPYEIFVRIFAEVTSNKGDEHKFSYNITTIPIPIRTNENDESVQYWKGFVICFVIILIIFIIVRVRLARKNSCLNENNNQIQNNINQMTFIEERQIN